MLKDLRYKIAKRLVPEEFAVLRQATAELAKAKIEVEYEVNRRVADALLKMDPFEPLLKKYNVIFSKEYERPEERLNEQGKLSLFMWAAGVESDPSFKYLVDWIRDTQGNATLRKAKSDPEWFYGRAAVATITLFIAEVSRLTSRYKDILAERGQGFDEHLPVE